MLVIFVDFFLLPSIGFLLTPIHSTGEIDSFEIIHQQVWGPWSCFDSVLGGRGSLHYRRMYSQRIYLCPYIYYSIGYSAQKLILGPTWQTRMHSSRMRTTRRLTDGGGGFSIGGGPWLVLHLGGVLHPRGGFSIRGGAFSIPGGVLHPGGSPSGGSPSQGEGVYHVTYPIMHLMLPVCCLHTNWDTPTVHLLIYCLVMWPAMHPGIPTPLWTDRHL